MSAELTRTWYWVTFAVERGKRGAIHEAKNCPAFQFGDGDVRIGRKKALALIAKGKA